MAQTQNLNPKVRYLQQLVAGGFQDIHVVRKETAERVLTEKRMELLDEISTYDATSMRDLARRLDRSVSAVSNDLDVLWEAGIIEYEEVGKTKRPRLAHQNVLVEPIVFEGRVPDCEA